MTNEQLGHIDHEADAKSRVEENLAMLLRRILARARKENIEWQCLADARFYMAKNNLQGKILR